MALGASLGPIVFYPLYRNVYMYFDSNKEGNLMLKKEILVVVLVGGLAYGVESKLDCRRELQSERGATLLV